MSPTTCLQSRYFSHAGWLIAYNCCHVSYLCALPHSLFLLSEFPWQPSSNQLLLILPSQPKHHHSDDTLTSLVLQMTLYIFYIPQLQLITYCIKFCITCFLWASLNQVLLFLIQLFFSFSVANSFISSTSRQFVDWTLKWKLIVIFYYKIHSVYLGESIWAYEKP